jgi:Ca2+-binding RTX toxin-like protein
VGPEERIGSGNPDYRLVGGGVIDMRPLGASGNTVTFAGPGNTKAIFDDGLGSNGNPTIVGSSGADTLEIHMGVSRDYSAMTFKDWTPGRDKVHIITSSGTYIAPGTPTNDLIEGTAYAMFGNGGKDTLIGGATDNQLVGGAGDDLMTGGGGRDSFIIDAGRDTVTDLGRDLYDMVTISAGATMRATLAGNWNAFDSRNDGSAIITANGFGFDGIATTGSKGWSVSNAGHASAVSLRGSVNADTLTGGLGADSLTGGDGRDTLSGGAGNDTLMGGLGKDAMTGGAGADVFRYASAQEGGDRIIDFTPGQDWLELSATGFGGGLAAGMDPAADKYFVAGSKATAAHGQFLYRHLQRAMLGQVSSDAALAAAELEWNRYAAARWP